MPVDLSSPPFPPLDEQTALVGAQAAGEGSNNGDPDRVGEVFTPDCLWRNRSEFVTCHDGIVELLTEKWRSARDCALCKSLGDFHDQRSVMRFHSECRRQSRQWSQGYEIELWEFDTDGLMRGRDACINDVPIDESERRYFGPRPEAGRGTVIPVE